MRWIVLFSGIILNAAVFWAVFKKHHDPSYERCFVFFLVGYLLPMAFLVFAPEYFKGLKTGQGDLMLLVGALAITDFIMWKIRS